MNPRQGSIQRYDSSCGRAFGSYAPQVQPYSSPPTIWMKPSASAIALPSYRQAKCSIPEYRQISLPIDSSPQPSNLIARRKKKSRCLTVLCLRIAGCGLDKGLCFTSTTQPHL